MVRGTLLAGTALGRVEQIARELRQHDKARLKASRTNGHAVALERDRKTGDLVAAKGFSDTGTPERQAKGDLVDEQSDTIRHKRSKGREAPIDRYRRRGELHHEGKENYRLWHAGNKLRGIFRRCHFEARTTADLLSTGGGHGPGGVEAMSNAAYQARLDYKLAMGAVGPHLAPILVHVACMDEPAISWASSFSGGGKGDGLPVLRLALQALARHFRGEST